MLGIKKPLKILDSHNYRAAVRARGCRKGGRRGRGRKTCTLSLIDMVL